MNILVTGGLGFIGSHTVVSLYQKGHTAVIIDDLSNAKEDVLKKLENLTQAKIPFFKGNVADLTTLEAVFNRHPLDGILHFAAYKAVGESVEKPIMYYENNLNATLNVAKLAILYQVSKFVFSSSCTVYGDQPSPFHEGMDLLPATNPYGATKQMSEQMLKDIVVAHANFNVTLLRYFNPIGAHESGLIGESPVGIPNNLMPYILDVALGKRPHLNVYGSDYPTPDGSGVRDYIHVMDLADAHVVALEKASHQINIYNVGTGKGSSVLEVVKAFETMNQIRIPLNVTSRRSGDIAVSYADPTKMKDELGFVTQRDLNQMVKDAWNYARRSHHA